MFWNDLCRRSKHIIYCTRRQRFCLFPIPRIPALTPRHIAGIDWTTWYEILSRFNMSTPRVTSNDTISSGRNYEFRKNYGWHWSIPSGVHPHDLGPWNYCTENYERWKYPVNRVFFNSPSCLISYRKTL